MNRNFEFEARNPNFETNSNDQKYKTCHVLKNWNWDLFRISTFEFRILDAALISQEEPKFGINISDSTKNSPRKNDGFPKGKVEYGGGADHFQGD